MINSDTQVLSMRYFINKRVLRMIMGFSLLVILKNSNFYGLKFISHAWNVTNSQVNQSPAAEQCNHLATE